MVHKSSLCTTVINSEFLSIQAQLTWNVSLAKILCAGYSESCFVSHEKNCHTHLTYSEVRGHPAWDEIRSIFLAFIMTRCFQSRFGLKVAVQPPPFMFTLQFRLCKSKMTSRKALMNFCPAPSLIRTRDRIQGFCISLLCPLATRK